MNMSEKDSLNNDKANTTNLGFTELVYQSLQNDELKEIMESTPESFIEYMSEPEHFKTLRSILIEKMAEAQKCTIVDSEKQIYDNLIILLGNTNSDNKKNETYRKKVKRWINGGSGSIEHFSDAIQICYALDLNLEQTNVFLNDCGFSSLSARNAEHAVHYYCLSKKSKGTNKTYEDAIKLLEKYNEAEVIETDVPVSTNKDNTNSSTTVVLWKGLKANWDSDEKFLDTYLIPNKKKFIGYSKQAQLNYFTAKNLFISKIITQYAEETKLDDDFNYECYRFQYKYRSTLRKYRKYQGTNKAALLLQSVLNQLKYPSIPKEWTTSQIENARKPKFQPNSDTYRIIIEETKQSLIPIRDSILDMDDIESQKEMNLFLTSVMTIEGIYKKVLDSMIDDTDRIRSIKKDVNKKIQPVMKCFPTPKSIKKYEDNPYLSDDVLSARKFLVLMYFCIFCYERCAYYDIIEGNNTNDYSFFFSDFSLREFMKITNHALVQSSLARFSKFNQFDLLILYNVRKIETTPVGELDNPISFFNDILQLMFDS